MVAALIISGSLAAVIAAIMLTRVGIILRFEGSDLYFAITIAGWPVSLNRFFNKEQKPDKRGKKRKQKQEPKKENKKLELPPPDKLYAIIIDSLGKLRRKITINELYVNLTIGGEVFSAAIICGLITELVGIIMPPLTDMIRIKCSDIVIVPAFTEEKSELKFRGRVSIAVGSLVRVALGAAIQYLKIRKEMKDGKASAGRIDGDDLKKNPRDGRREYHRGRSHSDA